MFNSGRRNAQEKAAELYLLAYTHYKGHAALYYPVRLTQQDIKYGSVINK